MTKGFSLIEIIVATAIFAVLVVAVSYTVANSSSNFGGRDDKQLRLAYAREAYEALQAIRDTSWKYIATVPVNTSYDVRVNSSGAWELYNGTSTRGTMSRNVYFYSVQRDSTGSVVTSGGTPDYNTRQVIIRLTGGGRTLYEVTSYIGNTKSYSVSQTNWNGTGGTLLWSGNALGSNLYSTSSMNTGTTGKLILENSGTYAAYGSATSSAFEVSYSISPEIINRIPLTLQWAQVLPSGCSLDLYVQGTNTAGPDFSVGSLVGPFNYTTAGTATSSADLTSYTTIQGKKYIRYAVSMTSCSSNASSPELKNVTLYVD